MGLILAIYTNNAYQEVHLPSTDNADYDVWLRAKEYSIRKDLHLFMDVQDQQWRFKDSADYIVTWARGRFTGILEAGQILQIETKQGDNLAMLVLASPTELAAYNKFKVLGRSITIGKADDCDICFPSQ